MRNAMDPDRPGRGRGSTPTKTCGPRQAIHGTGCSPSSARASLGNPRHGGGQLPRKPSFARPGTRGLRVVAAVRPDGARASLVLNWPAVTNNGGHDITGLPGPDRQRRRQQRGRWPKTPRGLPRSLTIPDDEDTTAVDESKPYSVDKDTLTYIYDGYKPLARSTPCRPWIRALVPCLRHHGGERRLT